MSYNSGFDFGYDQVFIDPLNDGFFASKNQNVPALRNMEEKITKRPNILDSIEMHQPDLLHSSTCACLKCIEMRKLTERETTQLVLADLQRKNDMLTMFIVFLLISIIMQYTTFNQGVYYANTMSYTRVGPTQPPV